MLKKVVLPAPFGPIRLTMERSGMSKSTESTATRPPKTFVTFRASRILAGPSFPSGTGPSPNGVAARGVTLVQLLGPLAVGYYPVRPQEHHQHQDDAEDEEVVLRDVCVRECLAPYSVAYGVYPLADLGQEGEIQALQGYGAQDHAVDAPHAAQDDHGEYQDGDVEREARRKDVLYERPVVSASQAPEHGPHGVGPELGRHRVDAHCGGRRLVLAHGDPGPPELGVPEAYVHVDRDENQDQDRVVPRVQVQRTEPLPGDHGIGKEREAWRVYGLDADGAVGQVEAPEVSGVLEETRDDLPEAKGYYRQVIPAQPEGRGADDHAAQAGESPCDNQDQPEREVYAREFAPCQGGRGRTEGDADLPEVGRGEPADHVGAEGVESHEAKVEEACEPDHDVQAEGKHDVDGDDYHRVHQVYINRALQEGVDGREQERDHDQDRRERELPEPLHYYSPPPCTAERSPSRPRGRKTSTRIRTEKITIGVQRAPMYWSAIAPMIPISSPPTTAPVRFPMPPRTA